MTTENPNSIPSVAQNTGDNRVAWNAELLTMQQENFDSARRQIEANLGRIWRANLALAGANQTAIQEIHHTHNTSIAEINEIENRRRNAQNTGDIGTIVRTQNRLIFELTDLVFSTRDRANAAEEALAQSRIT
jgi:hypothetical protein